ncbi:MAG: hypothetical protein QXV85_10360 [Candidatus Bathyarchaeia archaeon]
MRTHMPQKAISFPKPNFALTLINSEDKDLLRKIICKNAAKSSGQTAKATYALTAKVDTKLVSSEVGSKG